MKKHMRFISIVLALALLAMTFAGCANSEAHDPQEPSVTSDEVTTQAPEVTTEPVTTTEETTTEEVTTTEETTTEATTTTEETTTAPVTTTEATTTAEPEPEWVITPASEKLYATADLNVRATPEQSGERISHVDKGDLVEVTGWVDNGWARIKFRGEERFVNGKYLSKEKPAEVTTTVATTTEATTTSEAKTEAEPVKTYYYDYTKSKYDLSAAMTAPSMKELCKDYFRFGFGLTGNSPSNGAVNSEEYMAIVWHHANSVTLTNLMKPTYLLNQQKSISNARSGKQDPALEFSSVDKTLKWCYENGIPMRGHTLVWHTQTPDWFFKEGYQDNGKYVDYDTMAKRLDSYIKQVMTYCQEKYPGVIYCWDVVNEAVDPESGAKGSIFACRTKNGGSDNPWFVTLGEDYVELAFTSARKYAAEGVKLFYNDYNTHMSSKRTYVYKLCEYLKSKGLIDGLGMQDTWGISWPSISSIEDAINQYARLGIEIHISEMSISADSLSDYDLQVQSKRYEDIFKMLRKLDTDGGGKANITSVTIFGLMDGFVFYSNDNTTYTLFDTNFQPKPCFYKIQEVMRLYY